VDPRLGLEAAAPHGGLAAYASDFSAPAVSSETPPNDPHPARLRRVQLPPHQRTQRTTRSSRRQSEAFPASDSDQPYINDGEPLEWSTVDLGFTAP